MSGRRDRDASIALARVAADALVQSDKDVAKLRSALVRMLWRSIADEADCTCEESDKCPECEATEALGLGRWRGHAWARKVLLKTGGAA